MINLEPAGLDALIKYCEDLGLDATEILRQAAIDRLKGVERAPVVHARWEAQKVGPVNAYRCSNCGLVVIERNIPLLKYCHECGSRMDGGDQQ